MSDSRGRAVVLLSGGMDSLDGPGRGAAAGFERYALTILYGQRHAVERDAARRVALARGSAGHVEHAIDLRAFGGSALTDASRCPRTATNRPSRGIPVTYVPARNTVFLSLALAWAETLGAFDLFVGVNCIDYSGYPDCRPEFLRSFEVLANLATKAGVEGAGRFKVHAPLLKLAKEQIIVRGRELGVDFGLTHSCYDPHRTDGRAGLRCLFHSPRGVRLPWTERSGAVRLAVVRLGFQNGPPGNGQGPTEPN